MSSLEFDALSKSRVWCFIKLKGLILYETQRQHVVSVFHRNARDEIGVS